MVLEVEEAKKPYPVARGNYIIYLQFGLARLALTGDIMSRQLDQVMVQPWISDNSKNGHAGNRTTVGSLPALARSNFVPKSNAAQRIALAIAKIRYLPHIFWKCGKAKKARTGRNKSIHGRCRVNLWSQEIGTGSNPLYVNTPAIISIDIPN
jgi:hypothetical protein